MHHFVSYKHDAEVKPSQFTKAGDSDFRLMSPLKMITKFEAYNYCSSASSAALKWKAQARAYKAVDD